MLHGRDTLDLFNRISTNDLPKNLQDVWTTILITDKAKIIDVVNVFQDNQKYFVEVSAPSFTKVRKWIEQFIITEEVIVSEPDHNLEKFSFFGDMANMAMESLVLFEGIWGTIGDISCIVYKDPLFHTNVWNLYVPENNREQLKGILTTLIGKEANADLFEIFRIEQGSPISGKELTDHLNPLEAGLAKYVSTTKGCYLGQEVVARIQNYRKLQRILVNLSSSSEIKAGSKIFHNESQIGWVTSACFSPAFEKWICLAYVKLQYLRQKIGIVDGEGNRIEAKYLEPSR